MQNAKLIPALAAAIIALAPGTAHAAQATAELGVSATVADTCTVTAATALSFATIDQSEASNEAVAGAISVVCTANKTGVSVALGGGENSSGGQRRMSDGGTAFLPYNLFKDASRSSSVSVDGQLYSGNITAAVPTVLSVYGQIPAGNYAAGLYSDTILVTLSY